MCVDYNFNGQCDVGEPTATTDINGSYQLKESIAKSLGINSDITKVDPLKDPKLAAIEVTLSEVCPDVNQNGTAVETDEEGKTATYKWSVENRVIKLSGNNNYTGAPFTAYFVNFDKYIFVFDNKYKVLVFDVKNNKLVAATPYIEEL